MDKSKPRVTEFSPNYAFPPGDTIAEMLVERGMTESALAHLLGITGKDMKELIDGEGILREAIARKLEQVFQVPAHFWIAREEQYRSRIKLLSSNEEARNE